MAVLFSYLIVRYLDRDGRLIGTLEGSNISLYDIMACPLHASKYRWEVVTNVDINGDINIAHEMHSQSTELRIYFQELFK